MKTPDLGHSNWIGRWAVPKGHNMNSRGRQPTDQGQNIFDPVEVARRIGIRLWVKTHGYSCLAASRPVELGGCL